MSFEIYGLSVGTGEIRYVGQTTVGSNKRLKTHKLNARTNPRTPVQYWINKHGEENIHIHVLDTAETVEELDRKEIQWIANLRCNGAELLNVTEGGGGASGYTHSKETRERMSKALTGKKQSEDHTRRATEARWGRKERTDKELAHYAKMRAAKRKTGERL